MARDKKSFVFYTDWIDTFKALPKEKGYDLLMFILEFVNDENPKTDDILINAVFPSFKNTLERDLKKFKEIKVKRSAAGKLSAKKRAEQKQQQLQTSTSVESVEQTSTNPTVSESESVSDSVNVYLPTKVGEILIKTTSPLFCFAEDLIFWEDYQMKFKKIKDLKKLIERFELKVDQEELPYKEKVIKARLIQYSLTWESNESRSNAHKQKKPAYFSFDRATEQVLKK